MVEREVRGSHLPHDVGSGVCFSVGGGWEGTSVRDWRLLKRDLCYFLREYRRIVAWVKWNLERMLVFQNQEVGTFVFRLHSGRMMTLISDGMNIHLQACDDYD
jgi:hypothetical protein